MTSLEPVAGDAPATAKAKRLLLKERHSKVSAAQQSGLRALEAADYDAARAFYRLAHSLVGQSSDGVDEIERMLVLAPPARPVSAPAPAAAWPAACQPNTDRSCARALQAEVAATERMVWVGDLPIELLGDTSGEDPMQLPAEFWRTGGAPGSGPAQKFRNAGPAGAGQQPQKQISQEASGASKPLQRPAAKRDVLFRDGHVMLHRMRNTRSGKFELVVDRTKKGEMFHALWCGPTPAPTT